MFVDLDEVAGSKENLALIAWRAQQPESTEVSIEVRGQTISSLEIAELTGKAHTHVLRDIKEMLKALYISKPDLDYLTMEGIREKKDALGRTGEIFLDKRHSLILGSGYSVELRARLVDRWMALEAKEQQAITEVSRAINIDDIEWTVDRVLESRLDKLKFDMIKENRKLIDEFYAKNPR